MKDGSYLIVWTDLIVPGEGFDLVVRRGYKSRSLFNGLFGFGWCSDFESRLVTTDSGGLLHKECGAGLETLYTSSATLNRTQMRAANEEAVRQIAASRKSTSEAELEKLRREFERSLNNPDLRAVLISKYNIYASWRPPLLLLERYVSGRDTSNFIEFDGFNFVRHTSEGGLQRFDRSGKLVFARDSENNFAHFSYKDGVLRRIRDDQSRWLEIEIDKASGRIVSILSSEGFESTYHYKGEDLVEMQNAWGNTYFYEYDEAHNLTRIRYPDDTDKVLTYNQEKDWVTSFKERDGCLEVYNYVPQEDDPENHYKSSVTKSCDGKLSLEASYEFWHEVGDDGQHYLKRVLSYLGDDFSDTIYHPYLARPSTVNVNGDVTHYEYDSAGNPKKKITAEGYREHLEFDERGKYTSVFDWFDTSDKEKSGSGVMWTYEYDHAGNITAAHSSNSLSLKIGYDPIGRYKWISDATGQTLKIEYSDTFGKLHRVSLVGEGSITIAYNEAGDIEKLTSEEGEILAGKITRTFNDFLDVIALSNDNWFGADAE
ncbi:DUF6531 domain-containing protein [Roseovarius aestuarii]|nr:DUF6531 domain-containing protein [Roseovarius aestuarii]